ncbi:MAG TPA: nicotinate-nucleotide--dimethylbenzimidazole phosphoribosyltransferase [Acidimicrobiia bacterium]|jgi:nicotinate-nucleotide--dimethylbenzimidazole phosphoribosyltransferase|nr:nicotinate-nucleotide--dimethylbenzimidazole phosphoribosyltransferase [Acidimicrobiia bacterium]
MWSELSDPASFSGPDTAAAHAVATRALESLKPRGATERLDELAVWLAGWQRTIEPAVRSPVVLIFAGDHGVTAEGVSAYPASVTASMVEALRSGLATASVMARDVGARVDVVDVGVGKPTGNIRREPALSPADFECALETGRSAVLDASDSDVLVIGEVGIGNTTAAAAVSLGLFGGDAADWVGPGTGLDRDGLARKRQVVETAVARRAESGPWATLRDLGGWELAAAAGAVMEARRQSLPVLLDGFVVTAAAMPLEVALPGFLDHCWPAHVSPEPGHRRLVARLGRRPILDLGMRLGEGTGAIAALPVLSLAARSVVDVATFREAGLE